jgi:DNA repair exonuclease SbcCD ATPase subunit
MRLPYLRIVNFRNIAEATLDIGDNKLVVVLGLNHSGKSGIRQAISVLFTDSTEGLDPLGRGFVKKIRRGTPKSEITGDIQGDVHKLRRRVTLNTTATGRESKTTCIDDPDWHPLPFERLLELHRPALSVILNTDNFLLSLDEAKQKTLLSSLVLPAEYEFPADKIAEVERLLGKGAVNFTGEPLLAIDTAYKKLYKERETANRRVREFSIPDPLPLPNLILVSSDTPASESRSTDSKRLQEELESLRSKRRTIAQERDAEQSKVANANLEANKLDQRLKSIDDKIGDEDKRLKEINTKIIDDDRLQGLRTIISQKPKREAIRAQRAQNAATIGVCDPQLVKLQNLREAGNTTCPVCDQAIDLAKLDSIIAELQRDLNNLKRKDSEFVGEEAMIGNIEQAESTVRAHEEAASDKKAIQSKIAELNKQRTKAKKDVETKQVLTLSSDFANQIAGLDDSIQKLEADIRPIIVAESRAIEIKQKTEELEVLRTKAKDLDSMVEYFGKDGVKAELLGKHIGSFTEQVNHVLAAWGYKGSFTIEPYEFSVTNSLGVTSPVEELSDSEKLIFSIAMQCAVSKQSQIGLVVCDRMDTFLPEERAKVNACLYTMLVEGYLDQVWLIASNETFDVPEWARKPEARAIFYVVENGVVAKL